MDSLPSRCHRLRTSPRRYYFIGVSVACVVFVLFGCIAVVLYSTGSDKGGHEETYDKYDRRVAKFYDMTHGWCSRKDMVFWQDNSIYCACVSGICKYDEDRPHRIEFVECANTCICDLAQEGVETMHQTLLSVDEGGVWALDHITQELCSPSENEDDEQQALKE